MNEKVDELSKNVLHTHARSVPHTITNGFEWGVGLFVACGPPSFSAGRGILSALSHVNAYEPQTHS